MLHETAFTSGNTKAESKPMSGAELLLRALIEENVENRFWLSGRCGPADI